MFSFNTCGSGRRQRFRVANAKAFTRVSLYLYAVPGLLRGRVIHWAGFSPGRSAQSGLPQRVPSQSLVKPSKAIHLNHGIGESPPALLRKQGLSAGGMAAALIRRTPRPAD